ncbi:hypothetical protein IWQ60_004370 [Tieghemiomyces parasiticus]|uniref:SUN-like protein 1 n=1 Tax=Tieghemiomyces parasiticus TaxID=78921 RepID=A0A9W8DZU7_9FUNG|nr:hypothetical protein IWQ60_004370 [Tieghemiomyces parasiticus]
MCPQRRHAVRWRHLVIGLLALATATVLADPSAATSQTTDNMAEATAFHNTAVAEAPPAGDSPEVQPLLPVEDSGEGEGIATLKGHTPLPLFSLAEGGEYLPSFEEWRRTQQSEAVGCGGNDTERCRQQRYLEWVRTQAATVTTVASATLVPPPAADPPPPSQSLSEAKKPPKPASPAAVIHPGGAAALAAVKGRFNHASADCAAVVLKANPEAKGPAAVLTNSKERYMLNLCSATKFLLIELCDDILIDALALANYEFFSSTFKDFTVHVTDRYPPKDGAWRLLGRFQAYNSRETQIFTVPDPVMWARFIRIDLLTHYGAEYYCPVSLVRVYGNTIMEQYKREEEDLNAGIIDEADAVAVAPVREVPPKPKTWLEAPPPPPPAPAVDPPVDSSASLRSYWDRLDRLMQDTGPVGEAFGDALEDTSPAISALPRMPLRDAVTTAGSDPDLDPVYVGDGEVGVLEAAPGSTKEGGLADTESEPIMTDADVEIPAAEAPTSSSQPPPPLRPHASAGGTQESIFKTIMKRLGWLDRNMTMTYQYLEEQNGAINDILAKLDYAHRHQVHQAFSYLNTTTAKQIQALKITCEEIWKAIIFDVEAYEHHSRRDIEQLTTRLNQLSQDLVFEKRMRIAQLILLLAVILVVGLSKALKVVSPRLPEDKKEK